MANDSYSNSIMKFKDPNKKPYNRAVRPDNPVSLDTVTSRPAPYKWSTAENVMVAATPMLLGLITGDIGTGAEYAAKGLIAQQNRELSMDKELRGRQAKLDSADAKAKSSASSSLGAKKGYLTKDGIRVWKNPTGKGFVDADGNVYGADSIREYTPADMKVFRDKQEIKAETFNTTSPNDQYISKRGEISKAKFLGKKGVGSLSLLNKDQTKFADSTTKEYTKNEKSYTEAKSILRKLKSLISSPNVFKNKIAVTGIIKDLQGGRISDQDWNLFVTRIGPAKIKSFLAGELKGEFDPLLVQAIKDSTRLSMDKLDSDRNNYMSTIKNQGRARGIKSKDLNSLLGVKSSQKSPSVDSNGMVRLTDGTKTFKPISKSKAIRLMKLHKELRYAE